MVFTRRTPLIHMKRAFAAALGVALVIASLLAFAQPAAAAVPVASADNYVTGIGRMLTVAAPGLLANDNDADGDALLATVDTSPTHGVLVAGTNGGFRYTPTAGYYGTDTFTYRARGGGELSSPVTVTIGVGIPWAVADSYTTAPGVPLEFSFASMMANDLRDTANPDSMPLNLNDITILPVAGGTLVPVVGDKLRFTPATGFTGTYTFTYRVSDDVANSPDGIVSILVVAPPALGPLATVTVSPQAFTATSGVAKAFTAQGFDANGNDLGTLSNVTFTTNGTDTISGGSITFGASGSRTVTATVGAISGTSTGTVSAGAVTGITLTPAAAALASGSSQTFSAHGHDAAGNDAGVQAVVLTTNDITNTDVISGNTVTFLAAGTRTVQATTVSRAAFTATASVTVSAGAAASIVITPSSTASVVAGSTVTFTAKSYDANLNLIGDITSSTTFTNSGPEPVVSGNGFTFTTATVAGAPDAVTGTYSGLSASASVVVMPAALSTLKVTSSTASVTAGGTATFTVIGEDAYSNSLGDLTAGSTFTTSQDSTVKTSATLTFTIASSSVTVTALSGAISGTATVAVTAAAEDHVLVTPSSLTVVAGHPVSFTATRYDQFNNPTRDVTNLGSTSFSSPGVAASGNSLTFTAVGTPVITVLSGLLTSTTTVTITAGSMSSVQISPASHTVTAGGTKAFTVDGFDRYGNYLGDLTGASTFSSTGAGDTVTGSTVRFAVATAAGAFDTVTAHYGQFTSGATVTVNAGAVPFVPVVPVAKPPAASTAVTPTPTPTATVVPTSTPTPSASPSKAPATTPPTATPAEPASTPTSFATFLVPIGAIVLLLALFLIFFILRRRRREND